MKKPEKEYYIKTEKWSVGYQNTPIVEEIELGIRQGEIVTLIGPNGSGKSTILKSMAGQLQTISGHVYLEEERLDSISAKHLAKKMAVVFTERLRSELMTCEEIVETGRYPYTGRFGILTETDHKAVLEAMELVHVSELRDQDFTRISDGQRQRVMLARAICQEPEIILLDEPTSFLDIKYKLEFLSALKKLQKQKGITVIMSLHELELAELISDKVICVKGKYIHKFGKKEEVFTEEYIKELFELEDELFPGIYHKLFHFQGGEV